MTIVGASWPRSAHWGRYLLPVPVWVSAGPVQLDPNMPPYVPHSAAVALALAMVTSHTGLACYYLPLLSITQISTMLMHVSGKRGGTSADRWPLFPAVTTGDGGSRARCRTPFARCKRAHMWAEVISASATRVCWISAGVGAESGSPLGLMVPVFWHRAQLSPASNARLKCAAHYADLPGMDK